MYLNEHNMKIKWKKGLFSSKYELFFQDQKVGELKEGIFSRTSIGKLNKSKFKFQKMGFFSSETEITDLVLNKSIGKIKFNIWGNKAELKVKTKNSDGNMIIFGAHGGVSLKMVNQ